MFNWQKIFSKTRDRLVGVEITDTSIKLLEINKIQDDLQVVAAIQEPIATSPEEALSNAIAKTTLTTKKAITLLPYSTVHHQTIALQKTLTASEIEKYCYFAAEKYLGSNINLDYQISSNSNHEQQLIELVATQREHINTTIKLITSAKLIPTIIEVDCFALERATRFILQQFTGLVMAINCNINSFLLIALDQQKIIYAHEHALIALATQTVEQLAQHIINALEFCLSNIHGTYNIVVLAGEYPSLPDLATNLQSYSHCTVKVATITTIAPKFMLCLGMALRSPTLLQQL